MAAENIQDGRLRACFFAETLWNLKLYMFSYTLNIVSNFCRGGALKPLFRSKYKAAACPDIAMKREFALLDAHL